MTYFLTGMAYALVLALLVRFCQAIHRWDEENLSIEYNEKAGIEKEVAGQMSR